MELILLHDVRELGRRGEIVEVKPGYARNYLIPQGLGLRATKANVDYFSQQKKKFDELHTKERDAALVVVGNLTGVSVTIAKRSMDGESLYGSVLASEIAEALAAQGIEIDAKDIDLEGGIKTLGDHQVRIDLHSEVIAEIDVKIVAEE